MRCSSCEPLLDAYLEGTLPARRARAVASHVERCAGCAALLGELRVIDALLTTARPPGIGADFTASVVSAASATPQRAPRRIPLGPALLAYVAAAWALAIAAAVRVPGLIGAAVAAAAGAAHAAEVLGEALRTFAPAAPLAAAAVTFILLLDVLLFAGLFYGYRAFGPRVGLFLTRGSRT